MPQTTIDIEARKDNGRLHIKAQRGDEVIASIIRAEKVTTVLGAVEWVVAQRMKTLATPDIQRRVTFTFHVESTVDGDVVVVDSIDDVQQLPEDQGKADFESLPGWASWTAQEAVDWIEINVVDLASAKTTLQQMARAIVALRNRTID